MGKSLLNSNRVFGEPMIAGLYFAKAVLSPQWKLQMDQHPTLLAVQRQVYDTVTRLCVSSSAQVASGHDIRLQLLNDGLDKRTIAVTLGELVERKLLERVRVNEPSGLFYMAYRRVGDAAEQPR